MKCASRTQFTSAVGRLAMRDLADLGRDKERIGARRVVAGLAPPAVGFDRFAAEELQRLGRRLVSQGLALQVAGDRKDFQSALLGGGHALFGVFLAPASSPQRSSASSQLASSQPSKPVSAIQSSQCSSGTLPNWPRTRPI